VTSRSRRAISAAALLVPGAVAVLSISCRDAPSRLLLVVTVDTLRADRLGAYGSELGLTPSLDALAAESLVFEESYAPAPLTLPSMAALMTGRHPLRLGIDSNTAVLTEAKTLAERLSAAGWATGAVVGNYILRETSGLAHGFDVFDDELPQSEANRDMAERIAADTSSAALRVLDELRNTLGGGAGIFLWVHYQDPHGPYTAPQAYANRSLASEQEARDAQRVLREGEGNRGLGEVPSYQILPGRRTAAEYRAAYDGEIRYLDDHLEVLWEGLRERNLWADAEIVFTADHGEALGEEDYWFAHGERLNDPALRVPLLLRLEGVAPGRRRGPAALVDVVPTLLAHLGLDRESEARRKGFDGIDLLQEGLDPIERSILFRNAHDAERARAGVVWRGWKYVVELDPDDVVDGTGESLSRVGRESRELRQQSPGKLFRMRSRLQADMQRLRRERKAREQDLSEEDERMLRALGYLVGDGS